jgi:restriction endonuclease S subunit
MKVHLLKEYIDSIIDNRGKTPPLALSGIELIEVNAIIGDRKAVDYDKIRKYVSIDTYGNWFRTGHPHRGDVLISTVGAIGRVSYIHKQRGCIAQNIIALRPNQKYLDGNYLYYYLNSNYIQKTLQNLNIGVAQPSLKVPHLLDLGVSFPEYNIQRKIAAILSAYDDLIENNLRRIKILEEMAHNLYREWFVNFRLPGHEKAHFIDSPLGRIPEGWTVHKLRDIATIDKGLSYKGVFLTEDGAPMVNLKCIMPSGGFNRNGTKPYSGQYKSKQQVSSGDLVFANTDITQAGNVIGCPAIVPRVGFDNGGLASHHISIVRLREDCPFNQVSLYYLLLNSGFREHAKSCASGTTVLGFRSDDALDFEFIIPSKNIIVKHTLIFEEIYSVCEILKTQPSAKPATSSSPS